MSRAMLKHTQVAVTLAINVTIHRNRHAEWMILPLLHLTTLFMLVWQAAGTTYRIVAQVTALARDIEQAATFTITVIVIGVKALAFGLGVRL
jgi:hypothetical protein